MFYFPSLNLHYKLVRIVDQRFVAGMLLIVWFEVINLYGLGVQLRNSIVFITSFKGYHIGYVKYDALQSPLYIYIYILLIYLFLFSLQVLNMVLRF